MRKCLKTRACSCKIVPMHKGSCNTLLRKSEESGSQAHEMTRIRCDTANGKAAQAPICSSIFMVLLGELLPDTTTRPMVDWKPFLVTLKS